VRGGGGGGGPGPTACIKNGLFVGVLTYWRPPPPRGGGGGRGEDP
jgi:hypothetical protein